MNGELWKFSLCDFLRRKLRWSGNLASAIFFLRKLQDTSVEVKDQSGTSVEVQRRAYTSAFFLPVHLTCDGEDRAAIFIRIYDAQTEEILIDWRVQHGIVIVYKSFPPRRGGSEW